MKKISRDCINVLRPLRNLARSLVSKRQEDHQRSLNLRYVILGLVLLSISACTSQYVQQTSNRALSDIGFRDKHTLHREAEWGLSQSTRIALMPVAAKQYDLASRTASQLNQHFLYHFSHVFPHSMTLEEPSSMSEALLKAALLGAQIMLAPKIVNVSNHLNSRDELQEGRYQHQNQRYGRDAITVQLLVYEVQSGQLLDRIHLNSYAAYFKHDEQLPMHLLDDAISSAALMLARIPN